MVWASKGISGRYTDYLIPSGTGTRIVTYTAPLFSSDTGDVLPQEVQEEGERVLADTYQQSIDRLVAMADEAASQLESVK